ncbi:MAG: sulfotransferase [Tepidisphaeraceae bacterium]|jgi:hypothetical protein
MVDIIFTPLVRAAKYGLLKRQAERRVAEGNGSVNGFEFLQTAFLVGCGRSGTSIVGQVIGQHPRVYYFGEPYHLWATVDPAIDALNLFHKGTHLLLDERQCTAQAKRRFEVLMMVPARQAGATVMLEKTPYNACRIGYLEAIRPGSKFISLIRDGTDVARSIEHLSVDSTYRIAGKPTLNRWWGVDGSKWEALARDGATAGYFADEVDSLDSYLTKGAYEWLVTMEEVDRWRARLGDRLLELAYRDVAANPAWALRRIGEFLRLEVMPKWTDQATRLISESRQNLGPPLVLPPRMCQRFNAFQERFGFPGRAVDEEPE